MRNSDTSLASKFESLTLSVIPEGSLLTEDLIFLLYNSHHSLKPSEYPSLSRSSLGQQVKLLEEKGFLKAFSGFELRNVLKLPR